jgi:heme exporter protein D
VIESAFELQPGEVLFDAAALGELLSESSHPAHAFVRFPRKLDLAMRRGAAFSILNPGQIGPVPVLLVSEQKAAAQAEDDTVVASGLLLAPSGRLLGSVPSHPRKPASASPTRALAEVPCGQYRVRVLTPSEVDVRGASDRLSEEDRETLKYCRRWNRWRFLGLAGILIWVLSFVRPDMVDGGLRLSFTWLENSGDLLSFVLGFTATAYMLWLLLLRRVPSVRGARRRLAEAEEEIRREQRGRTANQQENGSDTVCLLSHIGHVPRGSTAESESDCKPPGLRDAFR